MISRINRLSWPRVTMILGMLTVLGATAVSLVALGWTAEDVASVLGAESGFFVLISGASRSFLEK